MDTNRASCLLLEAIQPFGGAFRPRPFRSRAELAEWHRKESAARPEIDSIVREWLSHGRWREGLHGWRADLATMRLGLALAWLGVPTTGGWAFEVHLETLLLECWPALLDRWAQEQELMIDSYEMGAGEGFRSFGA